VLEALECVEDVPLPARCGFWAVPGGVAVEVVTWYGDETAVRRLMCDQLESRHVPVRELYLREHPGELERPLPLRCDLSETSFGGKPARAAPTVPAEVANIADWVTPV
jgi:hypothetical protein